MNLDPKEVLEYVEASNNVMEAQSTKIEDLEKTSSDKDEKIQELETKLTGQEKVAQNHSEDEQKIASAPKWGTGEKQEEAKKAVRESDRVLYERFGVPIN